MTQKNQHKPRRKFFFLWLEICLIYFIAPDKIIKDLLIDYYAIGISNIEITKLLKSHYDTTKNRWVFLDSIYVCLTPKS